MNKPLFRYVTKGTKNKQKYATFDIETHGLGGEFLMAGVKLEDQDEVIYFNTAAFLVEFMFKHKEYRYYAHNGARYDFVYLVPDILKEVAQRQADCELIQQGAKVIGFLIKLNKKTLDIRDSYPLLNSKLEKAATTYAPDLPKLVGAIDFEKGEVYDHENLEHRRYLERDCIALLSVIRAFEQRIYNLFGTPCGYTAGATAIHAWIAHIPEGHCYWRAQEEVELFIRKGYFGGYVFPGYCTGIHSDVTSIDFNGAYAWAMRQGVPCGTPIGTCHFHSEYPGIYLCIVHVPRDIDFPPIPSRDRATGMLVWLTGTFETTVTSLEIEYGKTKGITFEVVEGYYWRRLEHPFSQFLARCELLELAGGASKEAAKIMRNSLYGKFGTKIEQESLFLYNPSAQPKIDGTWRPYHDETGQMHYGMGVKVEKPDARYIQPHWAAWITATQRIRLFQCFDAIGIERIRYADTDSIKADTLAILRLVDVGLVTLSTAKTGPGRYYGSAKVDEKYQWFEVLGVKNYRGILADGTFVGKTKGIPKASSDGYYTCLIAGEKKRITAQELYELASLGKLPEVHFISMNGIIQVMKHQVEVSIERKRRIGRLEGSKSWKVTIQGLIRPYHSTKVGARPG